MKVLNYGRRLGTVLAAATLALSFAGAASASNGQPDHHVPLRGGVSGQDSFGGGAACPAGSVRYNSAGSGQLSHLGAVTFTVTHCTYLTQGSFGHGPLVYTAANGDTLTLDHWGTFVLEMGPAGPVRSIVDLHWTVASGTGRFEGAQGSGTGAGVSDLVGGTTAMNLTGSIAYDASNRAGK